jgi:hypothetical protein
MAKPTTLTYAELKALNPCSEALARFSAWSGTMDAAAARKAGATFDDIVWVAVAIARTSPDVERRLRLWMADCATHVLHLYERYCPSDNRPRTAIIAARQFARGEISTAAQAAARDARDAWGAEETWQFDRLVLWLTNEPEDWPLPQKVVEAVA